MGPDTIDGIVNEPTVNFAGKDGFFWWVGEVEDSEDPMELGRVKVRVLGYYTNVRGGTTDSLPTEDLPWATVLQHTSQAGNDSQGESSGQLQPGAIVMGFFMDGQDAQMPIVMGVLRVNKSPDTESSKTFLFTGEAIEPGVAPGAGQLPIGETNILKTSSRPGNAGNSVGSNNSVPIPNAKTLQTGGIGTPRNIGTEPGVAGSSSNPHKPRNPEKPLPTGNGVGGPWKSLEYQLSYLIEDIADSAGSLISSESGDFIDIVSGKLVKAEQLTAKLANFLSAVFTQIVSAIRQSASQLVQELQSLTQIQTGLPYAVFTAIQQIISQILSSLCGIDADLLNFINAPIQSLIGIVESFLSSAISKAQMVVQGVNDIINGVLCGVQNIIGQLQSIISTITGIIGQVSAVAQQIIDTWENASAIFEEGTDLFKNGLDSITGIISFFLSLFSSNCNREPTGGKATAGYFPFFGVTYCTPAELDALDSFRGKSRGSCGDAGSGAGGSNANSGGSIVDSVFAEADPYLTAAKTHINGAYDVFIGTPGRQSTQRRNENGTTHTSINLNNAVFAEYSYLKKLRQDSPDMTEEEKQKKLDKYKKEQGGGKEDTGNLIADHSSYAGNYTKEVHGDDCETIDKNKVTNVEGDYRLKITGDCHIEVGGGFFIGAEGAPTVAKNQEGKETSEKVQKHTMRFGSDIDINIAGAKYAIQAAEIELAGQSIKTAGANLEVTNTNQQYTGTEIQMNAGSSWSLTTITEYHYINTPPIPTAVTPGVFYKICGSFDITMASAPTDPFPKFSINNPVGNYSCIVNTGHTTVVNAGPFIVNCLSGLFKISATGVGTIDATAALNLQSEGIVRISGKTIFLN